MERGREEGQNDEQTGREGGSMNDGGGKYERGKGEV